MTKKKKKKKTFKIFFSETTGPISIQFDRNVSLVTIYQDCSSHYDLSKQHGRQGMGLMFSIYLFRKLKKKSCQKSLDRFQYYTAVFNIPFMLLYQDFTSRHDSSKTWSSEDRAYFPYISIKLRKSSCETPLYRCQYNLAEMFLW